MKTCRRKSCTPSDCCGAAVYVRWLLNGDDLPDGWVSVDHRESHHSRYSRLIEKVDG